MSNRIEYEVVRDQYRGTRRYEELSETLRNYGDQGWQLIQISEQASEVNVGGSPEPVLNVVIYFGRSRT